MRSLTWKLIGAFLIVGLAGILLAAALTRWATATDFDQFVLTQARDRFISEATGYFELRRTWEGFPDYLNRHQPNNPPQGNGNNPNLNNPQPRFALTDINGIVIIPLGTLRSNDRVQTEELNRATPIFVDGKIVGYVLNSNSPLTRDVNSERFLAQTNRNLLIAAVGGGVLAVLLAVVLARTLTQPLRELTTAIRAMSQGNLQQKVEVRSQDEMGELAASFNQLSADLDRANQARQQMTADIAHDLRTPLSIITGYLEALHNGVLEANPARIEAMYTEARHLQHLVEDLRTLSLADAGALSLDRQAISPRALLERAANAYQLPAQQKNIELQVQADSDIPDLNLDPERMAQVLGNLLSNAVRYTPNGGRITLAAHQIASSVQITVQDTGVGIAPADLPRIFDRLYRGDPNRPESAGESGLGLAIAKSVVEAHRGTIAVTSTINQGTTFTITLPINK
jgi:signal transduction histidine kinase